MPPTVTDIRRISSGLNIPNCTLFTGRMGAFESEPREPILIQNRPKIKKKEINKV